MIHTSASRRAVTVASLSLSLSPAVRIRGGNSIAAPPPADELFRKNFCAARVTSARHLPAQFSYRAPPLLVFLTTPLLFPSSTGHSADSRIPTCYPRSFRQEIAGRFHGDSPSLLASKCSLILNSFVPPPCACCACERGVVSYSLGMKLNNVS